MSDSDYFHGDVRFPAWAIRYLPVFPPEKEVNLELEPSDRVYFYSEEECEYGDVSIIADLVSLGIPFDSSSAEYFEHKAKDDYFRFGAIDGQTEIRSVIDGDQDVPAKDIIELVHRGLTAAEIGKWCTDFLAPSQPLTPPLEEISERDYLEWLSKKDQAFRDRALSRLGGA